VAPAALQPAVVDDEVDSGAVPHPAGSVGAAAAADSREPVSQLDVDDAA
jgi:hypothetical protein